MVFEVPLQISLIVATISWLSLVSFLWFGENLYFRFGEYTFVGIAGAHAIVMAIGAIRSIGIGGITAGRWWLIIPIILGIMVFTRLIRGYEFLSRWSIAFVVGVGAAVTVRGLIAGQVTSLIKISLAFLFTPFSPVSWTNGIVTLIFFVLTLSVFTFSMEHKGVLRYMAWAGRIVIMIALGVNGATLGGTYFEGIPIAWEKVLATFGILPVR